MEHPEISPQRGQRDLKAALLVVALALIGYLVARPVGGAAYGGTVFGYISGLLAAGFTLWLAAYGLRRRWVPVGREGGLPRGAGQVRHWLSAHVYLGSALPVLAVLHAGFRFSWSVHTLVFLLLLGVTISGLVGVWAYRHYPREMTDTLGAQTAAGLRRELGELDARIARHLDGLPDHVVATVARACAESGEGTQHAGRWWSRCWASCRSVPHHDPMAPAIHLVHELAQHSRNTGELQRLMQLYEPLLQRQHTLMTLRSALRLETRMRRWLHVHVPLALALLAALFVHVATILIYW